jgi:hypothetical protein
MSLERKAAPTPLKMSISPPSSSSSSSPSPPQMSKSWELPKLPQTSQQTTSDPTAAVQGMMVLYQSWFESMGFSEQENAFAHLQDGCQVMYQQLEQPTIWFENDIQDHETTETLRKLSLENNTNTNKVTETKSNFVVSQVLDQSPEYWDKLYDPMQKLPDQEAPKRFLYAQSLVNELLARSKVKHPKLFILEPKQANLFGHILQVCQHFIQCDYENVLTRIHHNIFHVMRELYQFKKTPTTSQAKEAPLEEQSKQANNKQVILEFSPELEEKFKRIGCYFYLESACLTLFKTNHPTPESVIKIMTELIELLRVCHVARTDKLFVLHKNIKRICVFQTRLLSCLIQLMGSTHFETPGEEKTNQVIVKSLIQICELTSESLGIIADDYPLLLLLNLMGLKRSLELALLFFDYQKQTLQQKLVFFQRTSERLAHFFQKRAFFMNVELDNDPTDEDAPAIVVLPHFSSTIALELLSMVIDIFPKEMNSTLLFVNVWFAYMSRQTEKPPQQTNNEKEKDEKKDSDDDAEEKENDTEEDEEEKEGKEKLARENIRFWSLQAVILYQSFHALADVNTTTITTSKQQLLWTDKFFNFLIPFVSHIFNNSHKFSNMVVSNCVLLTSRGLIPLYKATKKKAVELAFHTHHLYTHIVRCFGRVSNDPELSGALFSLLTDMKEFQELK